MARPYHSPSSLKTGMRCPRAWAYRYVAGLREPEKPWHAFGKAGHGVLEAYFEARLPDWSSPAGIVAHRGVHYLPHPAHCTLVEVERGIGSIPLDVPALAPGGTGDQRPLTTALLVHGIRVAGFRDLLVDPDINERQRLGLLHAPGPITHDYKFVADVGRSAMTPEDLQADVQACSYALDAIERFNTRAHWCRWIYFQKRGATLTVPVLAQITRDQALEALAMPAARARELDTLTRVEDAPQNPAACDDYGGCGYHVTAGGPCNAQRSFGAFIQLRTRKDTDQMTQPVAGLDPAVLAKFSAVASLPVAPPPAPTTPTAAPVFTAPPPPVAPPTTPPAVEPAKRQRKSKIAPAVEAPPAPPPAAAAPVAAAPGGKGALIASLASQLAEAEARLLAEQHNVASLAGQIASVLAA